MTFDLIVVGTSLGGLQALKILLSELGRDFPLPIAIVQHRSKYAADELASMLASYTDMPVHEVEDKTHIEPGRIYLAPADYHLLVQDSGFALSTDAPVSYARPSIDVLFESAADCYGSAVMGVILTGSSEDGVMGAKYLEQHGGLVVIQDPSDAEAKSLPRGALASTSAAKVLPLEKIGSFISSQCRMGVS